MTRLKPVDVYQTATDSDANGGDKSSQDLVGRTVLLPGGTMARVYAVAGSGRLWCLKWSRGSWRGMPVLVDVDKCIVSGSHVVVDVPRQGQLL